MTLLRANSSDDQEEADGCLYSSPPFCEHCRSVYLEPPPVPCPKCGGTVIQIQLHDPKDRA